MPKVVAGEGRVELLVAEMADGRSADVADGAEPEAGASRGGASKEMLRAAGRARTERTAAVAAAATCRARRTTALGTWASVAREGAATDLARRRLTHRRA